MELLDGGLQLDDVGVPRLDVRQGLLGRSSVHDNALDIFHSERIGRVISSSANNMHCENSRIALFLLFCLFLLIIILDDQILLTCVKTVGLPYLFLLFCLFPLIIRLDDEILLTCVKTAGLPCSNMSSSSSFVVVRPAEH